MSRMEFKVRTVTPEISRLLQLAAFEAGYEWQFPGKAVKHTQQDGLIFGYLENWIYFDWNSHPKFEEITVPRALTIFAEIVSENAKPKEELIYISVGNSLEVNHATHKIKFHDNGDINIGCIKVDFKTIELIYGRAYNRHHGGEASPLSKG